MALAYKRFGQYVDALAHVFNTGEGVVLDRCFYTDEVFINTLYDMGYLTKLGNLHAYKKFT